jgi:hypothetical protein
VQQIAQLQLASQPSEHAPDSVAGFQRQGSYVGDPQPQQPPPPGYGNQFLDHSSTHGPAANFSVHSSAHGITSAQIFAAEAGPGFMGDESSNYTHHPFSTYGNPHVQEQENGRQEFGGGPMHGPHKYELNRPHIFINRKINRFMMGPIYRSKVTINSLLNHRYSGVPWRGGSTNPQPQMTAHMQMPMYGGYPQVGIPEENPDPQQQADMAQLNQSQRPPLESHDQSLVQQPAEAAEMRYSQEQQQP